MLNPSVTYEIKEQATEALGVLFVKNCVTGGTYQYLH